ncbi:MAG TPA: transposase, partial [Lactobacillus sp.]|nr:transposase [Lactobacillus sp.]
MGRKSKYSADFKLMIIHEAETLGITRTSRLYSISDHT